MKKRDIVIMAQNVSTLDSRKRVRRSFGQLSEVVSMPNLIEVQRSSYDQFLQMATSAPERTETGLQKHLHLFSLLMISPEGQF